MVLQKRPPNEPVRCQACQEAVEWLSDEANTFRALSPVTTGEDRTEDGAAWVRQQVVAFWDILGYPLEAGGVGCGPKNAPEEVKRWNLGCDIPKSSDINTSYSLCLRNLSMLRCFLKEDLTAEVSDQISHQKSPTGALRVCATDINSVLLGRCFQGLFQR